MGSTNDFARTWDGLPISKEPPTGTAVVVYRRTEGGLKFLILHRTHTAVRTSMEIGPGVRRPVRAFLASQSTAVPSANC